MLSNFDLYFLPSHDKTQWLPVLFLSPYNLKPSAKPNLWLSSFNTCIYTPWLMINDICIADKIRKTL